MDIIILLKIIYIDAIIFIKIINLFLMFKLRLNKKHVWYAWKMKNKNLLKPNVIIISVYNVIKKLYHKKDNIDVLYVENKIG